MVERSFQGYWATALEQALLAGSSRPPGVLRWRCIVRRLVWTIGVSIGRRCDWQIVVGLPAVGGKLSARTIVQVDQYIGGADKSDESDNPNADPLYGIHCLFSAAKCW